MSEKERPAIESTPVLEYQSSREAPAAPWDAIITAWVAFCIPVLLVIGGAFAGMTPICVLLPLAVLGGVIGAVAGWTGCRRSGGKGVPMVLAILALVCNLIAVVGFLAILILLMVVANMPWKH